MGVVGLQSFAEKECKTVVRQVSIEEAAERYRRRSGRTPLLIVDATACISRICEKAIPFPIFGCCQLKEWVYAFIKVLKTLKERNIDYVLFFDGSPPDERIPIFVTRNYSELEKKNEIMACLSRGDNPVGLEHFPFRHVEFYLLNQLKAAEISFRKAVRESDDEIMDFIAEHGCFGVLSQDTDFLIAEGVPNYFSVQHLTLRTLRTVTYQRENLARELGLPPWQLPYFATLSGNDVVTRSMLRQFHLRLLAHLPNFYKLKTWEFLPKTILFPEVVKWMKESLRSYWMRPDLPEVAADLIGCPELAHLFRRSVNSYMLPAVKRHTDVVAVENCPWSNILTAADSLVRKGVIHEIVRCVLVRSCLFTGGDLQFYDNPQYPCDVILLKPLRQRFYGILLKERPKHMGPPQVKEMMLQGKGTLDNFDVVSPVPPAEHPGLLTLWSDSCPVEPKWRLLCWAVSPDLDPEEILALPAPLRVPAMALYYMNNATRTLLRQWEVEALALQAVQLQTATLTDVRDAHCQLPGPLATHIATLYLNACSLIYIVSGACGSPTALYQHPEFVHFDGKMFHRAYQAIQEGTSALSLCLHRTDVSDCFRQVMSFLCKKKPAVAAAAPAPNPPEPPAKKDMFVVTDLQKAFPNLRF